MSDLHNFHGGEVISPENAKKHNDLFRESVTDPSMLKTLDEVQAAVDAESANMEVRQIGEDKLRDWAKNFLDVALDISEIEELNFAIQCLKNCQTYTFIPKRPTGKGTRAPITLYKTAFGTVDLLDRYILVLERTIVDLQNKSIPKQQYTDLSFFDLIKLSIKRLFTKRSK